MILRDWRSDRLIRENTNSTDFPDSPRSRNKDSSVEWVHTIVEIMVTSTKMTDFLLLQFISDL